MAAAYGFLALQSNGANKWTVVDAGNYALNPVKPAFDVYGVNAPSAFPAELTWMTKAADRNNNFNLTTGRFVAPVAGFYYFAISVLCSANSAASEVVSIRKNGTTVGGRQTYTSSQVPYLQIGCSVVLPLAAGDYVSVFSAASIYNSNEAMSNFCGFLIA